VAKILLADASKTCMLGLNWDMACHVFCPYDLRGWALISTYTPGASGNRNLTKVVFNSCFGSENGIYTYVYMMHRRPRRPRRQTFRPLP
jgi:hypothetical protein